MTKKTIKAIGTDTPRGRARRTAAARGVSHARLGVLLSVFAAVLLSAFALLAPAPALAEGTGTITVIADGGRTYQGYLLLAGQADDQGNLTYPSLTGAQPQGFYDALHGLDATTPSVDVAAGTGATDFAAWLQAALADDSDYARSVLLERAARQAGTPQAELTANTATELPTGYWLITGDETLPALVTVGEGQAVSVHEKASVPVVTKEVAEVGADGSAEWRHRADAAVGVEVPYRVTSTLPKDLGSFKTYPFRFEDTMAASLVPDMRSVRVELLHEDGSADDVTADFGTQDFEGGVLTVGTDDLLALGADASDQVRLTYTAHLTYNELGLGFANPNVNTVVSRFPGNAALTHTAAARTAAQAAAPVFRAAVYRAGARVVAAADTDAATDTAELAASEEASAELVTYAVRIHKVDAADGKTPLAGAEFVVSDRDGSYLTADGTWASKADAQVFTTGDDGTVTVEGLDAAEYTFEEVAAPAGYEPGSGFMIDLATDTSNAKRLDGYTLDVQLTGAVGWGDGWVDPDAGTVDVMVTNAKPGVPGDGGTVGRVVRKLMPQTGDPTSWVPIAVLAVAGAAAVLVGRRLSRKDKRAR